MNEKVLILGATGTMGHYLTEKLAADGCQVDAVSLDSIASSRPNLRYIQVKNAKDPAFVAEITQNSYDAIVDFLIYDTISFRETFPHYLKCTGQYVYLSSCRVFANEENPIRETSPRLLDVSTDRRYLFSDDYSLHKARGENALRASRTRNWTIVRPSTTYGRKTCQLLTLGRAQLLPRMRSGEPVKLYEAAKDIPASRTWGGDVAEMIRRLLFQSQALGEDYNVTSSASHTWGEIAEIYREIFGLRYEWVDELAYQRFRDPAFDPENSVGLIWQLRYARMFNRAYDNSKMLRATGLKQQDFLTLYQGLSREKPYILED